MADKKFRNFALRDKDANEIDRSLHRKSTETGSFEGCKQRSHGKETKMEHSMCAGYDLETHCQKSRYGEARNRYAKGSRGQAKHQEDRVADIAS